MKSKLPDFAVFDLLRPEELKDDLIKMFIALLQYDPGESGDVLFDDMVKDLERIMEYLDNPKGKHINEILKVVDELRLLQYILRMFFGFILSREKRFEKKDRKLIRHMYGVVDHLSYVLT